MTREQKVTGFLFARTRQLAVKTWASNGRRPLSAVRRQQGNSPLYHHIQVFWNPGYPTDIAMGGAIASGYPQLSYKPPPSPPPTVSGNAWDTVSKNVQSDAEELCEMSVASGGPNLTARIQCVKASYLNAWRHWLRVPNANMPIEFSLRIF